MDTETATANPFTSTLSPDDRSAILQRLSENRAEAIDALMADAMREAEAEDVADIGGLSQDRMYWAMTYDFQHAARVTQRSQLERIGYHFPTLAEAERLYPEGSQAPDRADTRWYPNAALIGALAELGVGVVNTEPLNSATLYTRLLATLDDIIPDLPPSDGVKEYLDMQPCLGKTL
ncbi:MAG: hypothetical protein FJ167_05880 [Gammaproteobacteria bacterium]|nr:hypothetical protein [Gammaproteobacteria bacterium]